jgi:cytochrome c biogenesis protein CcmG, thiol:disulfide interchange protein DsbE
VRGNRRSRPWSRGIHPNSGGRFASGRGPAVPSVDVADRRIPLVPVVVATVLAVAAASAVFLLMDGGDGGSSGASTGDEPSVDLTEPQDLPASEGEVVLGALDGGADRRLGDYLGEKPVVLNFFASWCQPCLREMPRFEAVHQEVGDRVTFLGLATQDRTERALEMVDRTGVTYPTFEDPDGSALTYFGGIAMPTTVFIDASGQVTDVVSQDLNERELRNRVDELLRTGAGG